MAFESMYVKTIELEINWTKSASMRYNNVYRPMKILTPLYLTIFVMNKDILLKNHKTVSRISFEL